MTRYESNVYPISLLQTKVRISKIYAYYSNPFKIYEEL
jgi:hypothetical protein